jgi:outer membrane protein assembly factor BamA
VFRSDVMLQEKKYMVWLLAAVLTTVTTVLSARAQTLPEPAIDSVKLTNIAAPPTPMSSPDDSLFHIKRIFVTGNRKTKEPVILRELPFHVGDNYRLQDLVQNFEKARKQLMNTTLFHEVVVALKSFNGYDVEVLVQVKERWYIFPLPYFKPVDRNLNQWLVEQKASLSRVNYGVKLLYNNVTGFNDKLRLYAITGYTQQFSLGYDRMYIDRAMKWGMNVNVALGKNREINYKTIDDKQAFLKDENDYLRNFFNSSLELTYRRAIKTRHRFGIAYVSERVSDSVAISNPSYFKFGRTQVRYPEIYYGMNYFDVDYIPYPTKGYVADFTVGKRGLNNTMNMWYINAKGMGSWHTGKNSFFSLALAGSLKAPFRRQPYFNKRILGYGDVFMQGYEYYVVDGVAGGYAKATFAKKIVSFKIRIPGTRKLAPQQIPINIYGKTFGNLGYVYDPEPGNNILSNRVLVSGGFGIDVFTIYDWTVKFEWSFNQLGQNGLYLHRKTIF